MATVNEQIVTGRKFRKLIDEATKLWQRISFWTKASDVEFDDGSTAETKMGAINGITDSLVSTSSNIAASAKALNQLNNKLVSQLPGDIQFIIEGSGEEAKYYAQVGADAASKKLLGNDPADGIGFTGYGNVIYSAGYQDLLDIRKINYIATVLPPNQPNQNYALYGWPKNKVNFLNPSFPQSGGILLTPEYKTTNWYISNVKEYEALQTFILGGSPIFYFIDRPDSSL